MRMFDVLFNGSWPKLSTHALEKCFENPHFISCSSFQNLRLGGVEFDTESTVRLWDTSSSCELRVVRATRVKGACVPVVLKGRACQSNPTHMPCGKNISETYAGLGRDLKMRHAHSVAFGGLAQSGVGTSLKSFFPHGSQDDDSMTMCLSKLTRFTRLCVCPTHK